MRNMEVNNYVDNKESKNFLEKEVNKVEEEVTNNINSLKENIKTNLIKEAFTNPEKNKIILSPYEEGEIMPRTRMEWERSLAFKRSTKYLIWNNDIKSWEPITEKRIGEEWINSSNSVKLMDIDVQDPKKAEELYLDITNLLVSVSEGKKIDEDELANVSRDVYMYNKNPESTSNYNQETLLASWN